MIWSLPQAKAVIKQISDKNSSLLACVVLTLTPNFESSIVPDLYAPVQPCLNVCNNALQRNLFVKGLYGQIPFRPASELGAQNG